VLAEILLDALERPAGVVKLQHDSKCMARPDP
jgi:hypothetical protein